MTIEKWDQFKQLRSANIIGRLWKDAGKSYHLGPLHPEPGSSGFSQARAISDPTLDRLIDELTYEMNSRICSDEALSPRS